MTNSDNFCLQWNDFQKNVTASIKEIRTDFCDVTLVGADNRKIEAHKVILAASSNYFRDILRHNPHPNTLIYMRGIKDDQLSAVVDFVYNGQTNVAQDDLKDFLKVAEELQLKGLSGTEDSNLDMDKDLKNNQNDKPSKKTTHIKVPKLEDNSEYSSEQNSTEVIDQTVVEDRIDIIERQDLVKYDDTTEMKISTTDDQLVETIRSMLERIDGVWSCTQCGKTNKDQSNLRQHIEAKHITGVCHSCNQCGKQFISKSALYYHNSKHRKQSYQAAI